MAVTKFPRTIKLVVIGAAGVGKTSMRGQYISQRFSTGYRATIGADFITKLIKLDDSEDGETVALQIWDTAGQERFSSLSSAFFRGADAAILVFDVNTQDTMHALQRWWDEFKVHAPLSEEDGDVGNFCVVLVGNKVDLEAGDMEHVVSHEEARAFMDKLVPPELYHEEEEEDDPLAASQMTARPTTSAIAYPLQSSSRPHSPFTSHSRSHSKFTSPYHQKSRSKSAGPSRSPRPYASSSVSGLSIYHTPSSSFFDQFASAQNFPELSGSFPSPSIGSSSSGNMSAVTLTPSNWDQFDERGHLNDTANGTIRSVASSMSTAESFFSAFSTGPGSSPQSQSPLHASVNPHSPLRSPSHPHLHLLSRPHSPSLLKPPPLSSLRLQAAAGVPSGTINPNASISTPKADTLTGPRLFFASAKTGEGVPDIFEYVARRVVRRWDYEDNLEREREEEERYRNGVGHYERQFAMKLGVESGSRNRIGQQRPRQHGGVMKGPVNGHGNGIRVHGHSESRNGMTAVRGRAREWTNRASGMSAGSCCS